MQKKVKRLQETNSKSKQEYALRVFALKDEKNKLLEENEALQGNFNKDNSVLKLVLEKK